MGLRGGERWAGLWGESDGWVGLTQQMTPLHDWAGLVAK